MVRRQNNVWRMCSDYRDLNKITIKEKLSIPNIDELLDELHGMAYFTKLVPSMLLLFWKGHL
jgi:hypothetical protein